MMNDAPPPDERDLRRLLAVLNALRAGNFNVRMPEGRPGIIGELAASLNNHQNMLRAFVAEVDRVLHECGVIGRLGCEAQVYDAAGAWKEMIDRLNETAEALTCQIRNSNAALKAAVSGDYSCEVTCDTCHGEYQELADHVNELIAGLRAQPSVSPSTPDSAADEPHPVTRTLTVMFVDIHDFTARAASMSRSQVVALLRRARDLVRSVTSRHGGRVVKSFGDGFLITFESPTESALAGREFFEAVRASNDDVADANEQLRLRVGICTGEVAVENDDVVGDAVNLASRIQQLATNGEAYLSESTYHAMNHAEVPLVEVGTFDLKGVAKPIRVYRAATPTTKA